MRSQLAASEAENRKLRSLLSHTKKNTNEDICKPDEKVKRLFDDMTHKSRAFFTRSYPTYVMSRLRRKGFYSIARRGIEYFRRIRLASVILAAVSYAFAFIQTSAFVILASVYTVFFIPIAVVGTPLLMLGGFFGSRKSCAEIKRELCDKRRIYVFFPESKAQFHPASFFCQNVLDLASDRECAVIIVSPNQISRAGIGKRRFYATYRREGNEDENENENGQSIFLLRKYFYFTFRNEVLSLPENRKKLFFIY